MKLIWKFKVKKITKQFVALEILSFWIISLFKLRRRRRRGRRSWLTGGRLWVDQVGHPSIRFPRRGDAHGSWRRGFIYFFTAHPHQSMGRALAFLMAIYTTRPRHDTTFSHLVQFIITKTSSSSSLVFGRTNKNWAQLLLLMSPSRCFISAPK